MAAAAAAAERRTLLKAFLAWKGLLLALVLATSLLPSYDTSTSLALDLPPDHTSQPAPLPTSLGDALAGRLTRWDAIYFTSIAHRGYLFEQEWAFGPGLPYFVSKVLLPLTSLLGFRFPRTVKTAALASIGVANASHFGAVLLLHALARRVLPRRLALTTALLHVISPAGVFLCAPYAEAPFAALSFAGYLLYAAPDLVPAPKALQRGLSLVISGALFGLATACRTNGILNGVVFAVELGFILHGVLTGKSRPFLARLGGAVPLLGATVIGGVLVAMGSVIPQGAAYVRYCMVDEPRPWCGNLVPSIYDFVQKHYWGTGFFSYWTLPNAPLFLLALPMLTILLVSSREAAAQVLPHLEAREARLLLSMALAQGMLALLTLTSYHVQIVTRLASGYPVWYMWLAAALSGGEGGDGKGAGKGVVGGKGRWYGSVIVRYMVAYAAIQGVLFSCFLPPA